MLAQIFTSHPAAVTGRAVARHGWGFLDNMPFDKTASDRIGLADMAVTTSGMAIRAMVAKHCVQSCMIFRRRACIQSRPIAFLRGMQTGFKCTDFQPSDSYHKLVSHPH